MLRFDKLTCEYITFFTLFWILERFPNNNFKNSSGIGPALL